LNSVMLWRAGPQGLVVVNKKQSITTGFSAKPKGKLDNAAGTCRVFVINLVLY